jgi:hypothetical protein
MTNQEFLQALKTGKTEVIKTDIDGREYMEKILKAGKKEVLLYSPFLDCKYRIRFGGYAEFYDKKQYRLKK